jgi:hypothetical protein
MKRAHASSGIPTPPPSFLSEEIASQPASDTGIVPILVQVMKDHSQTDDARPYSPLLCFLLLLMTGLAINTGAATQLCHLAQSSCQLF